MKRWIARRLFVPVFLWIGLRVLRWINPAAHAWLLDEWRKGWRWARRCNIEWIRSIQAQCQAAGVPVFVKQLGAKPYLHRHRCVQQSLPGVRMHIESLDVQSTLALRDPKGGDLAEWPADLRVREFPR